MLQKLHIQNYAIIDELQISFSDSLNIIIAVYYNSKIKNVW